MINVLMTIGLILLVISLCTILSSNMKVRLLNAVVNTLMVGVFMIKNILEGDSIMTIVFGVLFVLDIVLLCFAVHFYRKSGKMENDKDKFLKEIEDYGSTRY